MKNELFLILFLVASFFCNAQAQVNCYRVYLHDKANTSYSVQRPQEFLSDRAIAKRTRFNIDITEQDFPVNANYLQAIRQVDDSILIMGTSRWFNTILVRCPNSAALAAIGSMAFVDSIKPIGYLGDIAVFDMMGRMIYSDRIAPGSDEIINTESWFNGLYLLLAKSKKGWSEANQDCSPIRKSVSL